MKAPLRASAKAFWHEAVGLFVDDGFLAALVLLWLALCWLALPRLGLPAAWPPTLLFAGLVLLLAWSTLRQARRQAGRR